MGGRAILGAVVFATARLLHGDTPAAHAWAALNFVASRPSYATVHLYAVFAAFVALAGLIALANSLARPSAWIVGRAGVASSGRRVGRIRRGKHQRGSGPARTGRRGHRAAAGEQADLVRAAQAAAAATHGPSLVAMALLYGISLTRFGFSMVLDGYPRWLG